MAQIIDISEIKPISQDSVDMSQIETLPSYADGSSIETPINKSPVSAMDQMKLSLGNEPGNIKYLKSKFEDIKKDSDGNLIVKDQGLWHRVNPKTFDDPNAWEVTKNIVNKIPGWTGTMMDITGMELGGLAGSIAGPAGTIVGGGTGASGAEALRTSLGRLAGTYEATPEEQAKDVAWESLLTMGANAIPLGVKPGMEELKKSMDNIGKWASNYAKENISALWGHLTEAGRWATRRAMDNAPSVIGKSDVAIKAIGDSAPRSEAMDFIANKQSNLVSALATEGKQALQQNYRQGAQQVLANVPPKFNADIGEMMQSVQTDLIKDGYGELTKNGQLRILSESQVAERLGTAPELETKVVGAKTREALEEIAKISNQYAKYPELKGIKGAQQLMDLHKSLNESFDDLFRPDVPPTIKRIASQIKDEMASKMTQPFADVSEDLAKQYIDMRANYAAKKDTVDMFNDAVRNKQVDTLVKKLVSKAGSYGTFKDEAQSMAELLGDKGHKMLDNVLDWEASKGFVDFVPKASGGSSLGYALKAASTLTGQNVPRAVGKEIQYGSQFLGFLKSLKPSELKSFIGNDQNFSAAITPLMQAYDGEDHVIRQLLTGSGVVNDQNQ